jgi:NAD(P)H-hydrate epimerase
LVAHGPPPWRNESVTGKPVFFPRLASPENSALLDAEASAAWGLNPFALVEAAGRACAAVWKKYNRYARRGIGACGGIVVCAGPGNNGADALVMLRALLVSGFSVSSAKVLLNRFPAPDENSPRSLAIKALQAMGVPVYAWDKSKDDLFKDVALIIDGIAGTGIKGALEGIPLEMVKAVNKYKDDNKDACCVVSIDLPSGSYNSWKPEDAVISADYTLAIEPQKTVLYTPALRPFCGDIAAVNGIFPRQLLAAYTDADLLSWEAERALIPSVMPDAYKHKRGTVEIYAGSVGFTGAARIAATGAQAAGAGLVRLVVDDDVYPALASLSGGVMVAPAARHEPQMAAQDALLLGPGWGRGEERRALLLQALEAEKQGVPLILDADAIALLKDDIMEKRKERGADNRLLLTPHAGELEFLSDMPKARLLCEPALIADLARQYNAVILFKSHVMIVAAPDGSLGFIDGMNPALGAGGSGDFLAGLCAGIVCRIRQTEAGNRSASRSGGAGGVNLFRAAAAAGTLLVAASRRMGRRFYDPIDMADSASTLTEAASGLAGEAWLPAWQGRQRHER